MNFPLVSIIVPSYNQGRFLEETLLSFLNQDYPNKELIVIDGGSTDQSIEIIKKYQDKISYWVSEKDNGQSNAINKGLKKAKGEVINWLGSDDLLAPGTLSKVMKEFNLDPEIALVMGRATTFVDELSNKSSYLIVGEGAELNKLTALSKMAYPQPSTFFTRTSLNAIGITKLDETLHYGMDYDLYIKLLVNFRFKAIDDNLSFYRLHSDSKTSTSTAKFYKDWRFTFSKLLRSHLPESATLIEHYKGLYFYNEGDQKIELKKKLSSEELLEIYTLHILNGWEHLYENHQFDLLLSIFKFIRKENPSLFKKSGLNNKFLMLKYLPKGLLIRLIQAKRAF